MHAVHFTRPFFRVLVLLALVPNERTLPAAEPNWLHLQDQVQALGHLQQVPRVFSIGEPGSDANPRRIFFEGLPYRGKPTRVYAWLGFPELKKGDRVPAMVLVHGGGGTAFRDWVMEWNRRGWAAISIAVEGQTDERPAGSNRGWVRHEWGGPARDGIYADTDQPLEDQWMYHAVADTILARLLMDSLSEAQPGKVGLMGISWGGIITSTVAGIDNRFAFAIPVYGCGALADIDNHYGPALGPNAFYRQVWEPVNRLHQAAMPMLWLTWLHDSHFPLTAQSASYRAASGPRMISVQKTIRHSHPAGWRPEDSYVFAQHVIDSGRPWCRQVKAGHQDGRVKVILDCDRPVDRVVLFHTGDTGFVGKREWLEQEIPVAREAGTGRVLLEAALPAGTTAWYFNLYAGGLVASTDFVETGE